MPGLIGWGAAGQWEIKVWWIFCIKGRFGEIRCGFCSAPHCGGKDPVEGDAPGERVGHAASHLGSHCERNHLVLKRAEGRYGVGSVVFEPVGPVQGGEGAVAVQACGGVTQADRETTT